MLVDDQGAEAHDDARDSVKDFGVIAARMAEEKAHANRRGVAPDRGDPVLPTLPCDVDFDEFDADRPTAFDDGLPEGIDAEDLEWASYHGLSRMMRSREGATFLRLSSDVFIISVLGAQPLHHDRHIAMEDDLQGFSEHTWNIVAEPSSGQMLLCEVGDGMFEHFPLTTSACIYMNTSNRHALSRRDPNDVVVIVQVDGYGPDDRDAAVARIREVLAARPAPTRV
jgi:hypothetical protein